LLFFCKLFIIAIVDAEIINREYIRKFFHLTDSEDDIDQLDYIMSHLVYREYEHNSFLCRTGDDSNEMYFIESGTVVVWGKSGEASGVYHAGEHIGEYSAITGEKCLADMQARGIVGVYVLDKESLTLLGTSFPGIYASFFKEVYDRSTENYRKLTQILHARRDVGTRGQRKKIPVKFLLLKYSIIILLFLGVMIFMPDPAVYELPLFWIASPFIFMFVYLIITGRILETLVYSLIYASILLSGFNFISTSSAYMKNTIRNTADIIVILVLLGAITRLFYKSGSMAALKYIIGQRVKSARGTLFVTFLSMVYIAIDEYLSLLINSSGFKTLLDKKNIPREKSVMVMGITPSALVLLTPFSITGVYITGLVILYTGQQYLFLESIPYNFSALLAVAFILLLIFGIVPLSGGLKRAYARVKEGGELWPDGTDAPLTKYSDEIHGHLLNLLLPVFIFIVSSILTGTIQTGAFSINVLYGLFFTLFSIFFLYTFQQFMTPDQFFKNIFFGMESKAAAIAVFVVGKGFADSIMDLGFNAWLYNFLLVYTQDYIWLLPAAIFIICAIFCTLFDSPWTMFVIFIPISIGIATAMDTNVALFIGAVCAGGFIGNEFAPRDAFSVGSMLGVNPKVYYRARLPYIIVIAIISLCGYLIAGAFL